MIVYSLGVNVTLIVEVPVELINEKVMVKAEIQIRTLAMDLWASLEHKLKYKSEYCTDSISTKLIDISSQLHNIDREMLNRLDFIKKVLSFKLLKIANQYIT